MRPNEQTQPSPAKLVSVILFARASKQFTIQTSIIYQKENYSYVLKFHDIFEFFIMIFTGLARLLKTQNTRCRQFGSFINLLFASKQKVLLKNWLLLIKTAN